MLPAWLPSKSDANPSVVLVLEGKYILDGLFGRKEGGILLNWLPNAIVGREDYVKLVSTRKVRALPTR